MSNPDAGREEEGVEGEPAAVILMGVAGAGKTVVGRLVARRLGWEFVDADDLHPAENRAKMRAGTPLDETDRRPWLAAVAAAVGRHIENDTSVVVACSALRATYREAIRGACDRVLFVWLDVSAQALRQRLKARRGHFAGEDLLESQLATLDVDGDDPVTRLDASGPIRDVAEAVIGVVRTD